MIYSGPSSFKANSKVKYSDVSGSALLDIVQKADFSGYEFEKYGVSFFMLLTLLSLTLQQTI